MQRKSKNKMHTFSRKTVKYANMYSIEYVYIASFIILNKFQLMLYRYDIQMIISLFRSVLNFSINKHTDFYDAY